MFAELFRGFTFAAVVAPEKVGMRPLSAAFLIAKFFFPSLSQLGLKEYGMHLVFVRLPFARFME